MQLKALSGLLLCTLFHGVALAQGLTGTLIGTVKDTQGGVVPGVQVQVSSPALLGQTLTITTGERGELRFPSLPPGTYVLSAELAGFAPYREEGIRIGAGVTLERPIILALAGRAESIVVGSTLDVRGTGFATRVAFDDLKG